MRGQKGYTLVEMLIAIAITGFLVTVVGLLVQQTVAVPAQGGDHVDALHAVQNATHWLSQDGQTAKTADTTGGLNLTLPDDSVISYWLSGGNLYRTYQGSTMTIAKDISSANFTVNGRVITVDITAAPQSRWNTSESETIQVYMRTTG